ncbi:hypothetical protein ACEPAH_4171 [Sanghuangporus vaninii]
MLSPSELPAFIESLIKTWRTIKDYSELDEAHKALMKRCVENSQRFEHLMTFVRDRSHYSKATWKYISELVADAQVAIRRALTIALDWKRRLGISDRRLGSRAWRLIPCLPTCVGKKMLLDWKETEERVAGFKLRNNSKDDDDNSNDLDEEDTTSDQEEKPERTKNAKRTKRPSYLKERFSEAVYLIVGKKELTSALAELERLVECLNFAILTSDYTPVGPLTAKGAADILKFVSRAKRRRDRTIAVKLIDETDVNFRNLVDIDPEAQTGIYRVKSGPYTNCIVDPRDIVAYVEQQQEEIAIKETEDIVRLFAEDSNAPESQLSSAAGILPSCGYVSLENCLYGIIFRFPSGCAPPRTLRSLLIEGTIKHSLNDRVKFAIRLSTSVLVVHSLGLVHKSIKPDSILVTESIVGDPEKLYPYKLGNPYLLSFDSSRSSRGHTMRGLFPYPKGPNWETLYTHPRHFVWRERKYEMRDDVFSLGVCLLEIALWKSFFQWNATEEKYEDNTDVIDLTPDRLRREALEQGKPEDVDKSWFRQQIMVQTAKALVPAVMGDLFKDVIVACLTFGDPCKSTKSDVFESRFEDYSDLPPEEQSVHFVQQILTKLKGIILS